MQSSTEGCTRFQRLDVAGVIFEFGLFIALAWCQENHVAFRTVPCDNVFLDLVPDGNSCLSETDSSGFLPNQLGEVPNGLPVR